MDSSAKVNSKLRRVPKGFNEGRKVRVVARVKSFADEELDGGSMTSWISVNKPDEDASDFVTISFGDQPVSRKETCEVDYCYEQNEDTEKIFAREVKPLIPGVFDGHHATVIAYGARGTGKTSTIQGTIEKPGLASLSISELLLMAKEKEMSIFISYYEVYVDHVYDLLDPKRPTVLVLDNGQGKIQLKGLSRIPVKSLSDFYELYLVGSSAHKQGQKIANESLHRSHRGLIVYISSTNEAASDTRSVAKMNFVDMAGYEDARRKSTDGTSVVENSKINKSIYALLNVASALNSNDNHVPYRESKLTRILQDSLGGKQSKILMITCLNSSFCQDSIYMANLAARSCQVTKRVASDAIRKIKSSTNSVVHSSLKNQIPKSVSATAKKLTISRSYFSEKKASVSTASYTLEGRNLFEDATSHLGKRDKELSAAGTFSAVETSIVPEDILKGNHDPGRINDDMYAISINGDGPNINEGSNGAMINIANDLPVESSTPGVTSSTSLSVVQSSDLDKENEHHMINEDKSPPLSAQIQAIANRWRLTPTIERSLGVYDEQDVANPSTPWETFSKRSTSVKNSIVEDYLRILNTASKEELKRLKGIGEKRATSIIEIRAKSPQPFRSLDDLREIGLSAKQIKEMMKKEVAGLLFN